MRKTIQIDLMNGNDIDDAIREIERYQIDLKTKIQTFVDRLAKHGIPVVDSMITMAGKTYDENGIESGSDTSHTSVVILEPSEFGAKATLRVSGKDLLFIEFGSGIYYNGAVGSSPHPKGAELGYTIGSYGEGNGAKAVWAYPNGSEGYTLSHGTKATMPMYLAKNKIVYDCLMIAKEVFQ